MNQPQEISALIAFTAGLLSFISPCVLPLVPSYITYVTGASFKELADARGKARLRWATMIHSLLFIMGFSAVFILMGASASYLGQVLVEYQSWIMKVGGVLIIVLGIHFTGVINIPFLQMEKRFELRKKPLAFNAFLSAFDKIKRYMRWVTLISGIFMIIIGILFLTDTFREINIFFNMLTNP